MRNILWGNNQMADKWSFLTTLISAGSGLGGVWLGGWLTSARESKKESDRIARETSYLAILVAAHLDRFIHGCVDVAFDDGTREGRPAGEDGTYATTVIPPTFSPLDLNVDWKILPSELMYEILNLPYKTERLNDYISSVGEYDYPPDYGEFFWARQHGYAVLGLEVCSIKNRLIEYAKLPIEAEEDSLTPGHKLKEQRDKFQLMRDEYNKRAANLAPTLQNL